MTVRGHLLAILMASCVCLTACSRRDCSTIEAREALTRQLAERREARRRSADLYQEALTLYESGEPKRACSHLQESVQIDDRNAHAWMLLGVIEYEAENLFEAASAFHRTAQLEPMRYEPHFNVGAVLEKAGQYKQAIESYERALDLAPGELSVIENLARCYIRTGTKPNTARGLIEQALTKESRPEWRIWLTGQLGRLDRKTNHAP